MTKHQLQLAIEALFVKVEDLGDSDAAMAVYDGLKELGISFSDKKNIEFREDPNLDDEAYFTKKYVNGFKKLETAFLTVYNAALVDSGRKPINKIAA